MYFEITARCVKCGACESECPNGAIREEERQFAIDSRKCVGCGACISICPNGAVTDISGTGSHG